MVQTISPDDKEELLKKLEEWLKRVGLYGLPPFSTSVSLTPVKTLSEGQIKKVKEMMEGPTAATKKKPVNR